MGLHGGFDEAWGGLEVGLEIVFGGLEEGVDKGVEVDLLWWCGCGSGEVGFDKCFIVCEVVSDLLEIGVVAGGVGEVEVMGVEVM